MRKLYKKIFILIIAGYVICTLYNQQEYLNSYKSQQIAIKQQISEEKNRNAELASIHENVNSPEYIEQVAREKLDMYLPNERIYVDIR